MTIVSPMSVSCSLFLQIDVRIPCEHGGGYDWEAMAYQLNLVQDSISVVVECEFYFIDISSDNLEFSLRVEQYKIREAFRRLPTNTHTFIGFSMLFSMTCSAGV